jgi:hypothetical protein
MPPSLEIVRTSRSGARRRGATSQNFEHLGEAEVVPGQRAERREQEHEEDPQQPVAPPLQRRAEIVRHVLELAHDRGHEIGLEQREHVPGAEHRRERRDRRDHERRQHDEGMGQRERRADCGQAARGGDPEQ